MRRKNLLKIAVTLFAPVADVLMTTFLFAHGTNWHLFPLSIAHYSFTTSFIDLWCFTCLRASFIWGGAIGILKNRNGGPEKCRKYAWIIKFFACINCYYACAKLLAVSDGADFVAGTQFHWFLILFTWSLFASGLCISMWKLLSSFNFDSGNIASFNKKENMEKECLLKGQQKQQGISKGCSSFANGYVEQNDNVSDSDDAYMCIKTYGSINSANHTKPSKSDSSENHQCSNDKENQQLSKATLKDMLSYSLPDWPWILGGVTFLICASVLQVFLPLFIGKVVSGIVVSRDANKFVKDIVIMGFISLFASISAGLRAGFFMVTIQKFNIRVRNTLFKSITSQEIGFFDDVKTGDLTSRLTSDTTAMSDTIGLNCNIFLRNVIKGIGVCIFMFALSWRMSILTFMGLPVVFAVSEVYGNYYKKLQKQVQDRFAIANEVAEEVCSSMQTVRSFANEDGERQRYSDKLQDVYKIQFKQAMSYSGYIWSTQSIELLLTVSTLWFGGHLLLKNHLTAEHFISFILYQETLGECFSEIGEVYTGLMQALGAAEKVFELIGRKPKISTDDGHTTPDVFKGHISFRNVNFSYPMRPNQKVLENVSFDVHPGEVVALVGPSGGGKSSCVKLLQRFYDPNSGSVLLDGLPVSSYKHEYLHHKISMVGQEPVLYARSIKDNIVYGLDSSEYTESLIIEAAVKANCHSFIMELTQKYDTETGEKGTQLSGGQKQRVAIARAMVRDPCILLLDEATSALDTESEYLVQEALERSKSHRTVLLIAHRLSTVKRADRIVVIVNGQVQEIGSHDNLMEKQGVYYNLVRRQLHVTDQLDQGVPKKFLDTPRETSIHNTMGEHQLFSVAQHKHSFALSSSFNSDASSITSVSLSI